MKKLVLNLVNVNESDITYRVDNYPDGQVQLVLDEFSNKHELIIITSIISSDDLFILMQLSDIIKRRGLFVDEMVVTYLLAGRTDRVFNDSTAFTLKIVADVINSFNAKQVKILTPHSTASLNLIKNSFELTIFPYLHSYDSKILDSKFILVAPDEGAAERLEEYVGYYGNRMITCIKKRDENGKVASVEVSYDYNPFPDVTKRRLVVIDDLCDGGGTFLALAPELRKLKPKSLEIVVTHAVQRVGIERLASTYDKVYVTDSYLDWSSYDWKDMSNVSNVTIIPIVDMIRRGYDR